MKIEDKEHDKRSFQEYILNRIAHIPFYAQVANSLYKMYESGITSVEYFEANKPSFFIGISLMGLAASRLSFIKTSDDLEKDIGLRNLVDYEDFSYCRNPIYNYHRMMSVGWSIMDPNVENILLTAVHWTLSEILANHEEKTQRMLHGEKYEEYAKKVNKWIPKQITRPIKKSYASAKDVFMSYVNKRAS